MLEAFGEGNSPRAIFESMFPSICLGRARKSDRDLPLSGQPIALEGGEEVKWLNEELAIGYRRNARAKGVALNRSLKETVEAMTHSVHRELEALKAEHRRRRKQLEGELLEKANRVLTSTQEGRILSGGGDRPPPQPR